MRTLKICPLLTSGLLLLGLLSAHAQNLDTSALLDPKIIFSGPPTVVERSLNYSVTQTMQELQWEDGTIEWLTNNFTTLATGMHYVDPQGNYQLAQPVFELFNGGVLARKTAHQVILAPSPVAAMPVDLLMLDGQRLSSRVLGINLYDSATGQSVLIGETRDCAGQLIGQDTVIFADAFDGVDADLVYHLTLSGLSQEVVLRENLNGHDPRVYQFDPASTRIEVVTEFFDPPLPAISESALNIETDPQKRRTLHEPDFLDQTIFWPAMMIGQGTAFVQSEREDPQTADLTETVVVGKRLETIQNRTLLFEAARFDDLKPLLQGLPDGRQAKVAPQKEFKVCQSRQEMLKHLHASAPTSRAIQTAQLPKRTKGLVLDYNILGNSSNFTFRGDSTYYVSGDVTLTGTTTFEPGAVLKFAATSSNARVQINGAVNCLARPYLPVLLTGRDDDTAGERISSSTGTPVAGSYSLAGLRINTTSAVDLSNLRISYLRIGIDYNTTYNHVLSHAQFVSNSFPVRVSSSSNNPVVLRNLLLAGTVDSVFRAPSSGAYIQGEHLTIHNAPNFWFAPNGAPTVFLTNSFVIGVATNGNGYSGVSNVFSATDVPSTFQTVGAAAHYLASGSSYRNAGTANINAQLQADLKLKTTYPPVELTNHFTTNTTLSAQTALDTDVPDIGYHYASLDWAVGDRVLSGATLLVTNGASIGTYGSSGLILSNSAVLVSQGKPGGLNRFVRYNLVQEQANSSWTNGSNWRHFKETFISGSGGSKPVSRFRFTELPSQANTSVFTGSESLSTVDLVDCEVYAGGPFFWTTPSFSSGLVLGLTNSLFVRATLNLGNTTDTAKIYARNNLFRNSTLNLKPASTNSWEWRDNLFDGVTLTRNNNSVSNSYNGYFNTSTNLTPVTAGDITLTNLTYQTGVFGSYYLPTTGNPSLLLNSGSRNADVAGLYHYTTTTNQLPELFSRVDIGLHYAAANDSNLALDADQDGLPDYLEDLNGNGLVDSGESDFEIADSDSDLFWDGVDAYPVDGTQWGTATTGDSTAPTITLDAPLNATLLP